VFDFVNLGSSISIRQFVRLGSTMSVSDNKALRVGIAKILCDTSDSNKVKIFADGNLSSGKPSIIMTPSQGALHGTWVFATDGSGMSSDRRLKTGIAPLVKDLLRETRAGPVIGSSSAAPAAMAVSARFTDTQGHADNMLPSTVNTTEHLQLGTGR